MKPTSYSIVVEGELSHRYAHAFEAMRLEPGKGMTAIVGMVEDEADLRGLLDAVAVLGLSLVSVTPVTDSATSRAACARRSALLRRRRGG